jgi:hypothetical protein
MNRIEHLLSVLVEECAEVAQRCTKAQRFGILQQQVDQPLTNAQRITLELNDLYAVVEMIRDAIGSIEFGERDPDLVADKRWKVERYMERSRDLGALDREYLAPSDGTRDE